MATPMRALAAALLFAGCAAIAPEAGETYRALGTEPFWSVSIEDGRLSYESPNGGTFAVAAPTPTTRFNGRSYASDRLILDVTYAQCSDGMSDAIYADTVMVVVDGQILRGCGGDTLAPGTLTNSHWSIEEIDGRPVFEQGYFLEFGPERLSGRAGCNNFAGSYRRDGDRLIAGAIVSTRMACSEPAAGDERSLLAILAGPVAISRSEESDTLLLTGGAGTLRIAQVIN